MPALTQEQRGRIAPHLIMLMTDMPRTVRCACCADPFGSHSTGLTAQFPVGLACPDGSGSTFRVSVFGDRGEDRRAPALYAEQALRLQRYFDMTADILAAPRVDTLPDVMRQPRTTDPIAYTYNADTHCPPCAETAGMLADSATDSEGNTPGAVFRDSEWCGGGPDGCMLACGTCVTVLAEHLPDTHGYCNCGDGCEVGDCDSCGDHEGPYDESYEASGCSCPDCVAADAYSGPVA